MKSKDELVHALLLIEKELRTISMNQFLGNPEREDLIDILIERQMNRFMISYANAFNYTCSRKGSLFQSPFKRIEIKEEAHLQQAIIYTHANAQKHGIVKDFKEYAYSSYWEIANGNSLNINVEEVARFFGNTEKFVELHKMQVDHFYTNGWPSSKLE